MTLAEIQLINSKRIAVANQVYTCRDKAGVLRYWIGAYEGTLREVTAEQASFYSTPPTQPQPEEEVTTLPPSGPAGGDLDGTYPDPTVDGLQGVPVDPLVPTIGDVLTFDGSVWLPVAPAADFITSVLDTPSVNLTVAAGVLSADTIDDSSNQRVQCANNDSTQGTRHRFNFLDTSTIDFTIVDDAGDNEIEISADFADMNISQFTNDSGYLTSTGITPAALTKVDDTNVTLTLGGTPATSLLQAVSLTLGWTGTLADARIASSTTWNAKYGPGGTDVPIADGGTGASTKFAAQSNLGINTLRITTGTQTTTLATGVNITGLSLAVDANSFYTVDGMLQIGCNNTGGVVISMTIPSGTMFIQGFGFSTNGGAHNSASTSASGTLTTTARAWNTVNGSVGYVWIKGTFSTGVTSGTMDIQYASAVAGQTSSVFQEGTFIQVTHVA